MNFHVLTKWQDGGGKLAPPNEMAKSRTKQPLRGAFGFVLRTLHERHEQARGGRKSSHESIARVIDERLKKIGPTLSFAGTTLWRWEQGQVSTAKALPLQELSAFYGLPRTALSAVLEANVKTPDLPDEDGLRILENATHGTEAETPDSLSGQQPRYHLVYPLSGFSAVEAAARLFDASEELASLAEAIMHAASGGQTPIARRPPAKRPSTHRKPRRKTAS